MPSTSSFIATLVRQDGFLLGEPYRQGLCQDLIMVLML
jgi:hypothetical protein